jgi:hypothetical protein
MVSSLNKSHYNVVKSFSALAVLHDGTRNRQFELPCTYSEIWMVAMKEQIKLCWNVSGEGTMWSDGYRACA